MKNEVYSNTVFWNKYWQNERRGEEEFLFADIVNQYISWGNIRTYMEIGGAPGSIMSYMARTHGLSVATIEFCDTSILYNYFKSLDLTDYHVYNEDFSKFNVRNHRKKYDIVASWGFIEHFSLDVSIDIIQKHKELVSEKGYLIIELPNIRKMNWLIYRIFNYNLLKIHNTETMDIDFLKSEILKGNEFELLYANYYLTSFLDYNTSNEFFTKHYVIAGIFRCIRYIFKRLHMDNIPNKVFSPYIIMIARRR